MSEQGIVGVPRVPAGMLERAGLVSRLGSSPLTVIRAPGGSGKTVLMAQWAARQEGRGAWITVEPDSGTRLAFWGAAMDALDGAGDLPVPTDDPSDPDVLRGALLRAFRSLGEPVVLVVDDAHELTDALVVDDLLAVLRGCRNVTVLVGTRTRSELEAPREALTLDRTVLEPEELVLTAAEVEAIVGSDGSRFGTTEELLEASGGSPLLLRAILAGSTPGAGAGASGRTLVADYLRGLFRTHPELEAFASATSIPDDLDDETAQHLSGVDGDRVSELLEWLETEGLVMRRDAGVVARYRYHPLVREVLRDELRRHHPERFRRASLVASADAEARRHFLPALRHAVDAEDYTRASDICLHGGFTLLRSRGAAAILQQVPLRYVARLPFIAVVLGLAANARGERLRALELLTLALGASRAWRRSQRVAERAGLALVESVVLRITGRAADSVAAARRMLTLLEEAPPAELEEIADQLGSYRYQAALSLFRAGRVAEARLAAERVGISADALAAGTTEGLAAASIAALADAARGEIVAAGDTLHRIDAAAFPVDAIDGYPGALAHLARAIVELERGDDVAAARTLDAFGDRPNLEHGMLFTVARAFLALWRGEPEVGLRLLERREGADLPRARMTTEDRQIAAAARLLLHAALGQIGPAHAALRVLDRADPLATVLQAVLLLLEGHPSTALERLNGLTVAGPRLQAAAELLTASAAQQHGDAELARAALRRFLATSEVHGLTTTLLVLAEGHRPALWRLAAERDGTATELLDRLRAVPAPLRSGVVRVQLTRREADVLEHLRSTASFADIAAELSVSANTVKSQVRTLYRKLGVSNRDEALRAANLQGLFGD